MPTGCSRAFGAEKPSESETRNIQYWKDFNVQHFAAAVCMARWSVLGFCRPLLLVVRALRVELCFFDSAKLFIFLYSKPTESSFLLTIERPADLVPAVTHRHRVLPRYTEYFKSKPGLSSTSVTVCLHGSQPDFPSRHLLLVTGDSTMIVPSTAYNLQKRTLNSSEVKPYSQACAAHSANNGSFTYSS